MREDARAGLRDKMIQRRVIEPARTESWDVAAAQVDEILAEIEAAGWRLVEAERLRNLAVTTITADKYQGKFASREELGEAVAWLDDADNYREIKALARGDLEPGP